VIGQFSAFRSFLGSSTAVSAAIGDEAPEFARRRNSANGTGLVFGQALEDRQQRISGRRYIVGLDAAHGDAIDLLGEWHEFWPQ
jgi:hypothetical protein